MPMSFTWNSAYEAIPSQNLNRNLIDDEIRKWSRGIREFMEEEHNFGPFTAKDDGSHIGGKVQILVMDDAAAEAALSNEQEGALFLRDDGAFLQLRLFTGGAWQDVESLDHGELTGLVTGHDHTDLFLNQLSETVALPGTDLELNANDLITDEDTLNTYGGMTLYRHRAAHHPNLGAASSIDDGSITGPHLWLSNYSYAYVLPGLTYATITLNGAKSFLPNIFCAAETERILFCAYPSFAAGTGFGIKNTNVLISRTVSIRGKVLL